MAAYKGQQTKEVDGLIPVLRSRTKKGKRPTPYAIRSAFFFTPATTSAPA